MWRGGQDERTQLSFYQWYSHLVLLLLALLALSLVIARATCWTGSSTSAPCLLCLHCSIGGAAVAVVPNAHAIAASIPNCCSWRSCGS